MLDEVSGKQHSRLDAFALDVLDEFISVSSLFTCDQEAEPAWSGILSRYRKDQTVLCLSESCSQAVEVVASALHEGREFLELGTSDGCLEVCGFQVISEMGIYIFVVIAKRKLTVLSVKAVSAEVVMSGRADTVTAPVAEGTDDLV